MLRGMRFIHPHALCIFLLFSCTNSFVPDSKTLVIGIENEIKSIDIRTSMDMNATQVVGLFTQSLIRVNDQMLPEGELALSWSTKDAKYYDFQLPKDATFHDGSVLDCEDVLTSFEQASSPSSRMRSSFADVKSFSCPSSHHFRIELNNSRASFLVGDIAGVKILPKEHVLSKEELPPIGSGPYQFVERKNRDLIFKRFENFHRHKNGTQVHEKFFFDRIIVRGIQDPITRWLSLNSGEIDILINALTQQKVLAAQSISSLSVHRKPGNSFQYLGFNLRLPKFQNKKIRQALAHAINRDEIIEHKLYGFAQKASSVLSPLNYFRHPSLVSYEYDLPKAKHLLKESGIENLEIELKTSADRDITSISMIVREQLEQLGAKVSLRPYEFATFFSDVQKGNFEMFSLRWVAVTEPDILSKIFHTSQTPPGRNRVYYSNTKLDRLVERAALEPDTATRKSLYLEAQEIIADDLPYIPLWYPDNIAVSTAKLKGYELSAIGNWYSVLEAYKEE